MRLVEYMAWVPIVGSGFGNVLGGFIADYFVGKQHQHQQQRGVSKDGVDSTDISVNERLLSDTEVNNDDILIKEELHITSLKGSESVLLPTTTISISTGLFRRGEYVRFHALAQLPAAEDDKTNSKRFKGALKFEHRITNTRNISETEVQARELSKKALKRKGIPYLIALLIMTTLFALTIYRGFPKVMVYELSLIHI